jgi:hypothetical protein
MTLTSDDDLYVRGAAILVASWKAYTRGSAGAAVKWLDGVSAAVFPSDPERAVYNNALPDRDLGRTERAAAVDAMEAATTRRAWTATPRRPGTRASRRPCGMHLRKAISWTGSPSDEQPRIRYMRVSAYTHEVGSRSHDLPRSVAV